mgnify:CR=1 FL=1
MTRRACPLCDRTGHDGLVFHHWSYQSGQGVELCRSCHEHLHADGDSTPMTDPKWVENAVKRLMDRFLATHGRPRSAAHVIETFNIPDDAGILVSMDLDRRFPERAGAA